LVVNPLPSTTQENFMHLLFTPMLGSLILVGGGGVGLILIIVVVVLLLR
jgi:cellobiose-specific phosphotransferase system component IIC